ncbi:Glutathione transport system permease protein GsiD [Achromobacter insuavis]|uniref:ABC transporter permease n=1 Tax=Achromobacter insuavis TaxID=1287735 RepID=UPI0014680877|nr:ABC transporter permease [Achromobacter insuavis]CAB3883858.1 Glutathione transport system permease protein GsiD [Achromobacter insuavis]
MSPSSSIHRLGRAERIALSFLLLLALAALCGPLLTAGLGLADPYQIDAANLLSGPSTKHWLGTDELGRDLLARILFGARVSLSVAAAAVLIAGLLGVATGVTVAFLRSRSQSLAIRVIDVLVSLPEIFVALVVLAFIGGSLPTLIGTIGLLYWPQFARVSWGVARGIRAREHVMAAYSLGAGGRWIIWHEVLPNMRSIIAVQASFTFSFALLLEAGLSFLGLGVRPPVASWGQMVGSLKDYLFVNPWPVLVPALALFLTVLAVNVLGDWLQDVLNPELQR